MILDNPVKRNVNYLQYTWERFCVFPFAPFLAARFPVYGNQSKYTPAGHLLRFDLIQQPDVFKPFRSLLSSMCACVSQVRAYDNTPTITEVAHDPKIFERERTGAIPLCSEP